MYLFDSKAQEQNGDYIDTVIRDETVKSKRMLNIWMNQDMYRN